MKKLVLVTAFFDIGRGSFDHYKRTNEQYFEYFKLWARIHNELIIYCEPQNIDEVYKIRELFGLEKSTIIIPIDNIYSIESEIFYKMQNIEDDINFQNFRYLNNDPSNTAKYDYIMLMKWWFMNDATKQIIDDCNLVWIDFGFNHGDAFYKNAKDFDFLWEYDFNDKVNAFCLKNPHDMSLIDSLQFQMDCFEGCLVVIPKSLCEDFWNKMKESMNTLIDIGCMDDDQQLLLMVYKKYPELFEIRISDWFEAIAMCSNQSFDINKKEFQDQQKSTKIKTINVKNKTVFEKIYNKLMWCYRRIRYPQYPNYDSPFIKIMREKITKYYNN